MKILMLSRDPEIFREHSEVRQRMIEYGSVFEELHVVVVTKQRANNKEQIAKNVWVYPATFISAFRVAASVIHASRFVLHNFSTAQDPFELGLIASRLKKKFGIPLQLQVHTDFLSPYFGRESLKNRARVMLAKRLLPKADSIRVVSERIKKSLVVSGYALVANKISVLPIFVDTAKIKKAPVVESLHQKYPGRFIILMASRLTREKHILLALEAMRVLKNESFAVRPMLVIVGDGPEQRKLKVESEKLKVLDSVVLEPRREELVSYYKTADLFLLTSNYEGYGRTVVEAAAAGLPVLMTNIGCADEVIREGVNGFIVPVGDKRALAEKLCVIFKNPKLLEPLRRAPPPDLPSKKEYLTKYEASFHHTKS